MARLISYPTISTVASGDLFPVTDISDASKPLKNITAVNLQTFVNDGATLQRVVSTGNTYQAGPSDALWTWGTNAITANDTSFTSLLSSKRFKNTFIADGSYTDVLPNQITFNDGLGNKTSITTNTAPSLSVIDLQWPSSSGILALTTDITDSPWDTVTGGINYANGNVGIGTATPSAKLDVNGDALINGLTVGQGAGTSIYGNTVFGKTALNNITTGLRNVAIGNGALLDNTVGNYNIALGYQALGTNISGNNNVAIGGWALERAETTNNNTAVGYSALGITSGANNTAIGYAAGYLRVGGTNGSSIDSVFIGSLTKSNGIGSENEIVIGTGAESAGSNTVVLGNDDIVSTRLKGDVIVANGNVGIGTTSPSQKLHVDGNARVTGAFYDSNNLPGTSGQILSSTGAATSWIEPSSVITRLIPYFQTATPGGSDTYTQSNNIVDFDWSGSSGIYEYILPSATAIPYRKIRFVNNSTITASDRIRITAPSGETIDGGAFYEINKPYNGCAVWSDGVQWIVIQAKA